VSQVSPYDSRPGLSAALEDGVLRLRLNRPDKRNAIDDTMMSGLIEALDAAGRDEGVRVISLSAEGEHFCSGADVVARNARSADGAAEKRPRAGSIQRRLPSQAHRLIPLLTTVQTPVVCVVQGWAAGIGLAMALASDVTIAAADARFWAPFCERGFTPDSGVSWMLPRRIGEVRARQMLLLGRVLSGSEAADWQLIDQAVDPGELETAAESVIARFAQSATVAVGLAKWLMASGQSASLDEALRHEAFAMELSSRSEDFREGMAAFTGKRPARFEGR
jgi:2-(1,2-epoxy-1,2-dihydrophenyl)acetyl-CoA isomerase